MGNTTCPPYSGEMTARSEPEERVGRTRAESEQALEGVLLSACERYLYLSPVQDPGKSLKKLRAPGSRFRPKTQSHIGGIDGWHELF